MINLKAFTYNLVEGKIKKSKLSKEGEFSEDFNDYTLITSFTMPNVKVGSVIEYSYKIKSPYATIDDVFFQSMIPINKLNIYIGTPQYFQYNIIGNPKAIFYPEVKKRIQKRRVTITDVGSSKRFGFVRNRISQSDSEYEEDILEIDENNIPPLEKESYSGNLKKYVAKLSFELSAYLDKNRIVKESFSSSWDTVIKTLYQRDNFGAQETKTSFYQKDINKLEGLKGDELTKIFAIQEFIKSKVKWNGFYGIETQKGIRKAYKEGAGNVADVNLLLVSMLRSQGLDVNPVLVSTKDNGIPLFPTIKGFNYVICLVETYGEKILLDATEKYNMINILPYRVLNWQGRLIKRDGSSTWINLEAAPKSTETTMLNVIMDDSFSISGKVRKSYTSYAAKDYRVRCNNLDLENKIKSHESGKSGMEITEYNYENNGDITKPVMISYSFELSDGLDGIGGKFYFNPLFFFTMKENPFKLEKR